MLVENRNETMKHNEMKIGVSVPHILEPDLRDPLWEARICGDAFQVLWIRVRVLVEVLLQVGELLLRERGANPLRLRLPATAHATLPSFARHAAPVWHFRILFNKKSSSRFYFHLEYRSMFNIDVQILKNFDSESPSCQSIFMFLNIFSFSIFVIRISHRILIE